MNENLSQMVKDSKILSEDDVIFSESNLDLPIEEEVEKVVEKNIINIVPLFEWFNVNSDKFENINEVQMSIRGVDSRKTLIMAVKTNSGAKDEEGNDERVLRLFDDAHIRPVLNLPALDMQVYSNKNFKILYEYNGIFIKCYGVRTGLIVSFCNEIDGKIIPYSVSRIRKKDTELEVPIFDKEIVVQKLKENADVEVLQLLYKQSAKVIDQFSTNESVVDWLLSKQSEVTDISHHLQIDNVIIDMLK